MFFGNLPTVEQSFVSGRTIVCLKANLCLPLGKRTQTIELKCLVRGIGRQCKDTANRMQKQEKTEVFLFFAEMPRILSKVTANRMQKQEKPEVF